MKKALFTVILILISSFSFSQTKEEVLVQIEQIERNAEKLANQQLDAYNNRNLEEFLNVFSDSVEVYSFPNKLKYRGKENMRNSYKGMFENLTDLNCTITKRIVYGNKIIDSEEIEGMLPDQLVKAVVIYTIENDKIQKVHFVNQL